jgi:hypothetical protein
MRNLLETDEEFFRDDPEVPVTDPKILELISQLRAALNKIESLEASILANTAVDSRPWKFDVQRDSNGFIDGVIAHRGTDRQLLI